MKKQERGIREVTLNTPTIHGLRVEPSAVNFIFGKNGTGKSSIARALATRDPARRESGEREPEVYVYNEEYIEDRVQALGDVQGIYTFSKRNVETRRALEALEKARAEREKERREKSELLARRKKDLSRELENYQKTLWRATSEIRRRYPLALGAEGESPGRRAGKLAACPPEETRPESLDCLYEMAFQTEREPMEWYTLLSRMEAPACDRMETPILTGSDTALAAFYRALGNFDWAKTGHDRHGKQAGGKCPFCGQALQADFEAAFAACVDDRYRKDMEALKAFSEAYERYAAHMGEALEKNAGNPYESRDTLRYHALAEVLRRQIRTNQMLIRRKNDHPREELTLEDTGATVKALDALAEEINRRIARYREAAENLPREQERCAAQVWDAMAAVCRDWKKPEEPQEMKALALETARLDYEIQAADQKIKELQQSFADTTEAMESINQALASCGFTGFFFRKKEGNQEAYELIRRGEEEPAKNLSEGERKFVAFLYFYHRVMKESVEGGRIVVIDDPVCSMDSEVMLTVVAMIRHMIRSCLGRYENRGKKPASPILQMFVLSHNRYFFQALSDDFVPDYAHCAFFEVTKGRDNISDIRRCESTADQPGREKQNESPVQGFYQSLWRRYLAAVRQEDLLHYAQQILYHYFLQTCHVEQREFMRALMDENREEMIAGKNVAEEQLNTAIIYSLLTLMGDSERGFLDGMSFDLRAVDPGQIRRIFEKIFTVMHQEQHYRHMARQAALR